jgi:SpoVK/Ycf46/Vps4 family AAA+-type ATPase
MTTGNLLRKLLQSYKRRDDQAFEYFARQIVAEEREKHHNLLADDLANILDGQSGTNGRRSSPFEAHQLEQLPRDREKNSLLFDIRKPRRGLEEIVLDQENERIVKGIVRQFNFAERLQAHGLQPDKTLLFCGPPGCGKTLCSEVLAQALGLPMLYTRFDGIISSYLGETAANLRKVFDFARRGSWVVVFDEFDAIGKSRDDADEHGELKRVVNSFLQLLDDFSSDSLVIAITNHESLLDSALWRRFDEVVFFGPPDQDQILALLRLKLANVRHADLKLPHLSRRLQGMTHADIERICTDAMKESLLAGEPSLTTKTFVQALARHRRRAAIVASRGKASRKLVVEQESHEAAVPTSTV